jgi:hypothetical protein
VGRVPLSRAQRAAPWGIMALFALLATLGYGHGNIIGEGAAELHVNLSQFLSQMSYAWEPRVWLGTDDGFTQVYLTPYTWLYAIFYYAHVPEVLAQRCVIFALYCWVIFGMYWGLRHVTPEVGVAGRLAGAGAYLLNIYVAFNSAGSVPMLLTYGSLPWILGAIAAYLDDAMILVRAAAIAALAVFVGSGVNPPLIAINLAVIALYVFYRFLAAANAWTLLVRLVRLGVTGGIAALLVNLYWIVGFLRYIKTAWIGGVLDESPTMHNADSSFSNIFRGLGQWGIFRADATGDWYNWAHAYAVGTLGSWLLWGVLIVGATTFVHKRKRPPTALFYLLVILISVPLAVGYYEGTEGPAITLPLYDWLYRHAPDFQMFRSAYKWVGAYEFGASGLFAVGASMAVTYLRERWSALRWVPAAAFVLLPLVAYAPVIFNQANQAMNPLPPWMLRERSMLGTSPDTRTALFPSQYQERFYWGNPAFYVEHGIIGRPMIYGYLGASSNEASDEWMRLAYRRARQGDPIATDIFGTLSVGSALQRDDFWSDEDFSFPDAAVTADATIAHDVLTRVMGYKQTASDGANRVYVSPREPVPLVYGVESARITGAPAIAVPTSIDILRAAAGGASVSIDGLGSAALRGLFSAPLVAGSSPGAIADYTTTNLLHAVPHVELQRASTEIDVPRSGRYRIEALSLASDVELPITGISIDGKPLRDWTKYAAVWRSLGVARLRGGPHTIGYEHAGYFTSVLIAFVDLREWQAKYDEIAAIVPSGKEPSSRTVPVKAPAARLLVGRSGAYRLIAQRMPIRRVLDTTFELGRLGSVTPQGRRAGAYELLYVPARGVIPTAIRLTAQGVYEDARTFSWNRGAPFSSSLLTGNASFRVYSPVDGKATLHVRFAPLAGAPNFTLLAGGVSTVIAMPPRPSLPNEPAPVSAYVRGFAEASVAMHLRRGYNSVIFSCERCGGIPVREISDALDVRDVKAFAAIAGLSFTETLSSSDAAMLAPPTRGVQFSEEVSGTRVQLAIPRSNFTALQLPLHDDRTFGDPRLLGGVVTLQGAASDWIGAEFTRAGRHFYRYWPFENPADFSIALLKTLPNFPDDSATMLDSAWLLLGPPLDATAKGHVEVQLAAPFRLQRTAVESSGRAIGEQRSVTMSPGRAASAFTLDLGARSAWGGAFDELLVPVETPMKSNLVALEARIDGQWQLVGERLPLDRVHRSAYDGGTMLQQAEFATVPWPRPIAAYELHAAGRVLTPCCSDDRLPAPGSYALSLDPLENIVAATAAAGDRLVLTIEPSSWIERDAQHLTLRVPRWALDGVPPNAPLRAVYRPSAADVATGGGVAMGRAELATYGENPSARMPLAVDGKPASGVAVLTAGPHVVAAVGDGAIDTLTVESAALGRSKRVPMDVGYHSPVDITAAVPPSRGFLLVFNASYHPGWQAWLDGRRLAHVPVNGFANGWLVPRVDRTSQIEIRFEPQRGFVVASWISALSMVVVLAGLFVRRRAAA